MNKENINDEGYEANYDILHLERNADWHTTRMHYRKLVHVWHPDKYSTRPREKDHANRQFIELTKSFNQLKGFYKLHGRLPFEATKAEQSRPDVVLNADIKKTNQYRSVDQSDLDLSTLSRDVHKTDERVLKRSPMKKIIWTLTACTVVLATITLFFILDNKTNQQNVAIGEKVLREAPESEFTPTLMEIRRSESKGAFIEITR